MGIRPEDIHEAGSDGRTDPETIKAKIEVLEPMGVARLPAQVETKTGAVMGLHFDQKKLHFFDAETEIAIHWGILRWKNWLTGK